MREHFQNGNLRQAENFREKENCDESTGIETDEELRENDYGRL
jgi:hypothetical protein